VSVVILVNTVEIYVCYIGAVVVVILTLIFLSYVNVDVDIDVSGGMSDGLSGGVGVFSSIGVLPFYIYSLLVYVLIVVGVDLIE